MKKICNISYLGWTCVGSKRESEPNQGDPSQISSVSHRYPPRPGDQYLLRVQRSPGGTRRRGSHSSYRGENQNFQCWGTWIKNKNRKTLKQWRIFHFFCRKWKIVLQSTNLLEIVRFSLKALLRYKSNFWHKGFFIKLIFLAFSSNILSHTFAVFFSSHCCCFGLILSLNSH